MPFSGSKRVWRGRKKQPTLRRLDGEAVSLRGNAAGGWLRPLRRVPKYWRNLAFFLAGAAPTPEDRSNTWILVLTAKKIPHLFFPGRPSPRLYVPPMHELAALREIRAVEAERPIPVFVPPARNNIWGVVAFLFLLFFWHGLRWGWFSVSAPVPPFPDTIRGWATEFGLDMHRFRSLHEFWRAITALTLHADDSHLFSNLGFGLLFLIPLCRRAGLGLGLALAVLAGVCGNTLNAFVRDPRVLSIGFSTALFGGLGALCALSSVDIFRHLRRFSHLHPASGPSCPEGAVSRRGGRSTAFLVALAKRLSLPLAAGLGLLGILGGGGEARTDYSAHILGFCSGLGIALLAAPLEKKLFALPGGAQKRLQSVIFVSVIAFLALTWLYALGKR